MHCEMDLYRAVQEACCAGLTPAHITHVVNGAIDDFVSGLKEAREATAADVASEVPELES